MHEVVASQWSLTRCYITLNVLNESLNKTFPYLSYIVYEAAIAIKKSNFLICFCSFYLSCPILEKDIALSCLIN